jgi:hypothetical protein
MERGAEGEENSGFAGLVSVGKLNTFFAYLI